MKGDIRHINSNRVELFICCSVYQSGIIHLVYRLLEWNYSLLESNYLFVVPSTRMELFICCTVYQSGIIHLLYRLLEWNYSFVVPSTRVSQMKESRVVESDRKVGRWKGRLVEQEKGNTIEGQSCRMVKMQRGRKIEW